MGYNAIDLLDKAIMIAAKRKKMYQNIAHSNHLALNVKTVANVLARDSERSSRYYEELKLLVKHDFDEEIDFATYDKISSLVNQFAQGMICPNIESVEELLNFSVDFEKGVIALYIDMQGRLIKQDNDMHTEIYQISLQLIQEKEEHIKNLQVFMKSGK